MKNRCWTKLSRLVKFNQSLKVSKEKIITLKQEDINGKMKTRFYPFISDKGMCFNQRWTFILGWKII